MITDNDIDNIYWQASGGRKGYDEAFRATMRKWLVDERQAGREEALGKSYLGDRLELMDKIKQLESKIRDLTEAESTCCCGDKPKCTDVIIAQENCLETCRTQIISLEGRLRISEEFVRTGGESCAKLEKEIANEKLKNQLIWDEIGNLKTSSQLCECGHPECIHYCENEACMTACEDCSCGQFKGKREEVLQKENLRLREALGWIEANYHGTTAGDCAKKALGKKAEVLR